MKYKIIICDLCGEQIFRRGWYVGHFDGAIQISAKQLKAQAGEAMDIHGRVFLYPEWKRRRYHICAKCLEKIKEICKGGPIDEHA